MRILKLAVASLFVLSLPLGAVAQNDLPPTWSTTNSAPGGAFKTGNNAQAGANPQGAAPQAKRSQTPKAARKAAHDGQVYPMPESGGWMDVSAPLSPAITPVYEGNPPLQIHFTMDMDRGDKLDLSEISMGTHTGTHVDAPLHFVRGAAPIDEVPLDKLVGPALVIDMDPSVIAITAAELNRYPWRGAKRILFRTRNSVNAWIIDPHFHRDFTFVAPDAAQLMADNGVELVGIDYLSIEQFGAPVARTHQILLSRGIPIVEGLDLRAVVPGEYDFVVLPLKILGHEAAPARAILRRR
jgi:arylformamidase